MAHFRLAVLILLLCIVPEVAAADPAHRIRTVEIINMHTADVQPAAYMDHVTASTSVTTVPEFHLYTLRHDQVATGAQTSDTALQLTTIPGHSPHSVPKVVPTRSSIMIPAWLSDTAADIPTVAKGSGCTDLSYRPTGFLKPQAEMRRARYYSAMSAIACEHGIPASLFDAMIIQESQYDPEAVSPRNARGLIQLMPGTARELGVDPADPAQNLRGGARYLRRQLDRFGQVHLALAAYNAGPARICGDSIPAIRETRDYVSNILSNWSRLARNRIVPSGLSSPPETLIRKASVSIF
jgi:hypothetical protein